MNIFFFLRAYSTSEWKGWWKEGGGGKTFFLALQKLVKAIFLRADASQWCSCLVDPGFTFNVIFCMGVLVAKLKGHG